jgi:hypothetical protein
MMMCGETLCVKWTGADEKQHTCIHPWQDCAQRLQNRLTKVWHDPDDITKVLYIGDDHPIPYVGISGALVFAPLLLALLLAQRKP